MGEYITYKNSGVKTGTCESLYYTSFEKYVAAEAALLLVKHD